MERSGRRLAGFGLRPVCRGVSLLGKAGRRERGEEDSERLGLLGVGCEAAGHGW